MGASCRTASRKAWGKARYRGVLVERAGVGVEARPTGSLLRRFPICGRAVGALRRVFYRSGGWLLRWGWACLPSAELAPMVALRSPSPQWPPRRVGVAAGPQRAFPRPCSLRSRTPHEPASVRPTRRAEEKARPPCLDLSSPSPPAIARAQAGCLRLGVGTSHGSPSSPSWARHRAGPSGFRFGRA